MLDNTLQPKSDSNGVYSSCFRCGWYSRGYIQTCPTCTQIGLQKQMAEGIKESSQSAQTTEYSRSSEPGEFSMFIGKIVAFCILASLCWWGLGELWAWLVSWPTWVKWTVGLVLTAPIWGPLLDKKIMES